METIIKSDAHRDDMSLLLDRLEGVTPKGVIHVGAHEGEEVPEYLKRGFSPIVLFEPNPSKFELLRGRFGKLPDLSIYPEAVCDREGEAEFHIYASRRSGNAESSSLLRMKRLQTFVDSLAERETVKVKATSLDAWLEREKVPASDFNLLVTDVQGADYFALAGAERLLRDIDAVITEVCLIELYEGAKLADETIALMRSRHFSPRAQILHELYDSERRFPAWGEMLFLRSSASDRRG